MGLNLQVQVIEASDAKKIWIKDITNGYGFGGYLPVTGITQVTITFYWKHPVLLDYSDPINTLTAPADVVLPVINITPTAQEDLIFEVLPSDISPGWTVFPEGIYYIGYKITGITGVGSLPDNNNSYILNTVLYAQTTKYYDNLVLKIAREVSKIEDNYLFWYTQIFGSKFEGLKKAIEIWDYNLIRIALKVLQDLQTKYIEYNDSRRYYKLPFRS